MYSQFRNCILACNVSADWNLWQYASICWICTIDLSQIYRLQVAIWQFSNIPSEVPCGLYLSEGISQQLIDNSIRWLNFDDLMQWCTWHSQQLKPWSNIHGMPFVFGTEALIFFFENRKMQEESSWVLGIKLIQNVRRNGFIWTMIWCELI